MLVNPSPVFSSVPLGLSPYNIVHPLKLWRVEWIFFIRRCTRVPTKTLCILSRCTACRRRWQDKNSRSGRRRETAESSSGLFQAWLCFPRQPTPSSSLLLSWGLRAAPVCTNNPVPRWTEQACKVEKNFFFFYYYNFYFSINSFIEPTCHKTCTTSYSISGDWGLGDVSKIV